MSTEKQFKIGVTSGGSDISAILMHSYIDGYLELIAPDAEVVFIDQTWNHKEIESKVKEMDGIFMTGGADIWPGMYGVSEINPKNDPPEPIRDHFDYLVIDNVLKYDIPFFAVCRGSQMVNVYHGGTLYQDMVDEYPDLSPKQIFDGKLLSRVVHKVSILDGPLAELYGKVELGVNTGHHQAVKDVGEGLTVCAVAEDGIVEGTYRPDKKFFLAVQWHPEFMVGNEDARKLMTCFTDAARANAK